MQKIKIVLVILFSLLIALPSFAQTTNTANVSVSVPPRDQDFQNSINIVNTQDSYQPDTEITYRITYGSYLADPFPVTLTANWTQGTVDGDTSPSVDILDYVVGSATNGVNSTSPVVDTVNSKITWTFNSFPANTTDKAIEFKLKTNSNYKGSKKVSFTVNSKLTADSLTKTSSVTGNYVYPQSSSQAANTPTPTVTITPTPSPIATIVKSIFKTIEIRTISNDSADIYVSTTQNTKLTLLYGKSLGLGSSVSSSEYLTESIISLKKLDANTIYFFKVIATDVNSSSTTSDIFTFKTSADLSNIQIASNSFVIVSNNNVIFDTSQQKLSTNSALPFFVIPQKNNFQFKFSIKENGRLKNVRILLRKLSGENVLGANTLIPIAEANSFSANVVEIQPGVYSAIISSDLEPGTYELIASFTDGKGNLAEQKLINIRISNPFTVLNYESIPIEGARVFLYIYNETNKQYIPLSSSFLNIGNPQFTNGNGTLNLALPIGRYKAVVSDIAFKSKTVFFEISETQKNGYPIVKLEKSPVTPMSLVTYYWDSFNEVFLKNFIGFAFSLSSSIRFFYLISTATFLLLIFLFLYAFSRKNNIQHFPQYLLYLLHHLKNPQTSTNYIKGVIKNNNKELVSGVNVYLIDSENQEVSSSTKTNSSGEFFFRNKGKKYKLMAMKKGYIGTEEIEIENLSMQIEMEKVGVEQSIKDYLKRFANGVLGISLDVLLITTLFYELLFVNYFGLAKIAPFMAISLFNIFVWIIHLRHIHRNS